MTAAIRRARAESRALAAAAASLAREAQNLERAAGAKAEFADHLERLATIPDAIARVKRGIERGLSESAAIIEAADDYELRADCLALYWQQTVDRLYSAKKWRRDREIMRLAQSGRTNAEIAETIGLKPKSISKLIRTQLRAGWAEQQRRFRARPAESADSALPATKLLNQKPVHARLTARPYPPTPGNGSQGECT